MSPDQATELLAIANSLLVASGHLFIWLQRAVLILGWILASFVWKNIIYAKNQREWWAVLLSFALASPALADEWIIDDGEGYIATEATYMEGEGYEGDWYKIENSGQWASYYFDVPAGRYYVYVTWIDTEYNSYASWVTVDGDDESEGYSGALDQRVSAVADETRGGRPFQMVAVVDVSTDGLLVYLREDSAAHPDDVSDYLVSDAVMLILEEEPDPGPCDGKVWPGHPDWLGGCPEDWPSSFTIRWGSGNGGGYFPGTETSFSWGGVPSAEDIWPSPAAWEHYEVLGGWSDGKIKVFCVNKTYDVSGDAWDSEGAKEHVSAWIVWNSDSESSGFLWPPSADAEWQTLTECPISPLCLFVGRVDADPEDVVASGYNCQLLTEVEVCDFAAGGGDGGGGTACCCGAIADLVEQMQAEHEEPGETFSEPTPAPPEQPFEVGAVTLPSLDDPGRVGSWDIPIVCEPLGLNTHLYLSTDLYSAGSMAEPLLAILSWLRTWMLFTVQLWFYKRPLKFLRGL